jgi:hypothetical protein
MTPHGITGLERVKHPDNLGTIIHEFSARMIYSAIGKLIRQRLFSDVKNRNLNIIYKTNWHFYKLLVILSYSHSPKFH